MSSSFSRATALSPRQIDCLALAAQGLTSPQIGKAPASRPAPSINILGKSANASASAASV